MRYLAIFLITISINKIVLAECMGGFDKAEEEMKKMCDASEDKIFYLKKENYVVLCDGKYGVESLAEELCKKNRNTNLDLSTEVFIYEGCEPIIKYFSCSKTKAETEKEAEEWEKEKQRLLEKTNIEMKKQKEIDKARNAKRLKDTPINKLTDKEQKQKTNLLKKECQELGFKEDSKKFKDCVVELME